MFRDSLDFDATTPTANATPLDVYFGLVALLDKAGVSEARGTVSCRKRTQASGFSYVVQSERRVRQYLCSALSALLGRSISPNAPCTLSPEEAQKVAQHRLL